MLCARARVCVSMNRVRFLGIGVVSVSMRVARNLRAGVTQVLVCVSKGPKNGFHFLAPQPYSDLLDKALDMWQAEIIGYAQK